MVNVVGLVTEEADHAESGQPVDLVEIVDVWKRFGQLSVLKAVSLRVSRGDVLCLLGPSGSGKSTLLRCINHLETIDAGSIKVDGDFVGYRAVGNTLTLLPDREIARRRRKIGMVFQRFHLFPQMTARQNVMHAPVATGTASKEEAAERALKLLGQVGMTRKADAFPRHLSGGEQQRVAIARALAMEPQVMLFDEATSALDPELVRDVLDVMRDLAGQGMTMIVVTHEMGFAREVADRVAFMDRGQILEVSEPAAFFHQAQTDRARDFIDRML